MSVRVEDARLALPYIAELKDEVSDPEQPLWSALFAVQRELERIVREDDRRRRTEIEP